MRLSFFLCEFFLKVEIEKLEKEKKEETKKLENKLQSLQDKLEIRKEEAEAKRV